jgi:putative transcriptional regulator
MTAGEKSESAFLDGQLLIAMPTMADPRFARSVIYMCAHSAEGAMGIVVNQQAESITFGELLKQLNIAPRGAGLQGADDQGAIKVHVGGPVEPGRGFVLHTTDYRAETGTLSIDDKISLTATLDILKAMAEGRGPSSALLALGYAGWAPGQLESELHSNGWLNCPANPELVFGADVSAKYEQALATIGVDPSKLASEAGHA